jgi:methionyl-tRNA formyltransferase
MQKDFQGVRINKGKTEFCVRSPAAKQVDLCLFTPDEKREVRVPMLCDDDGNWHAELPGKLIVGCGGKNALEILELIPSGAKRMNAAAFRNGLRGQLPVFPEEISI